MGKGRKVSRKQGLGPGEADAERQNGAARRNGQRQNGAARRNGQQQDGGSDGVTSSPLTLGQLVTLSGVPASTVHHYRRLGLLPAPQPARSGRFAYGEDHVRALVIIRELREERGMPLGQIKVVLPGLLEGTEPLPPGLEEAAEEPQQRLIEAAIRLFSEPKGYASVTVSEIAAAAGIAKGSVYRHFPSKEALFTAVVENLCQDTADRFAQAVAELGGPDGLASDPAKTAIVFGRLITRAMPILLELGARAARGDVPSQLLAARVLRTLAEAAGRPLSDNPVPAGLEVIETAFHTVLQWAVGPDWASRDTPA
jgi:AcrR family transcriptional regulator